VNKDRIPNIHNKVVHRMHKHTNWLQQIKWSAWNLEIIVQHIWLYYIILHIIKHQYLQIVT